MASTLGKYYKSDSIIHLLDPRCKIISTMIILFCIFFANNFYHFLTITLFIFFILKYSKIPFLEYIKALKPFILLLIFTIIFQTLTHTQDSVYKIFIFPISKYGFLIGLKKGWFLILILSASTLLTYTTTSLEITHALNKLFSFLKKTSIPINDLTFMSSVAIKFLPILLEEVNRIKEAQMARGVLFDGANIFKKGKNLIYILLPVFISTFQRSNELIIAMQSRCFNGTKNRGSMRILKYQKSDIISYIIISLFVILQFLLYI